MSTRDPASWMLSDAIEALTSTMLPSRNRRGFEEIPQDARQLKFIWGEQANNAITAALETAPGEIATMRPA